jgi:hypothetical protein
MPAFRRATRICIRSSLCVLLALVSIGLPPAHADEPQRRAPSSGSVRLPASAQMRRDLGTILSAPEFAQAAKDIAPSETDAARFWRRLLNRIDDFMRRLSEPVTAHPRLATVLMALLMALLIYVATRLALESFAQRASEKKGAPGSSAPTSASDFVSLASQAAAAGDYQNAVRFAFVAFIRSLEIEYSSNLTNRAILRALGTTRPSLIGPASAAVRIFEDSWYGKLPVGAGEYAACSALLDHTLRNGDEAA